MLQYVLTGLAGLALGLVAMRVWQSRHTGGPPPAASPDTDGRTAPQTAESALGTRSLLIAAGVLGVLGAAVFLFRPNDASGPVETAGIAEQGDGLADVDTMIARLATRLEANPDDGEGFRMLGWSYLMTGRPQQAIEPFKRALELLPDNAAVHAGYGEALVGIAGGTVTQEAKGAFDKASAIDPKEPRSRYFLAMWLGQHGQKREALDQWIALSNEGPADAPWQADLRSQIDKTSGELGIDVTQRLTNPAPQPARTQPGPADAASVTALPPGEQKAAIDAMVTGLSEKLKSNPGDVEGWVMLLRSRMVLGQSSLARQDLVVARKALAKDPAGLKRVEDAAAQYGVPGA